MQSICDANGRPIQMVGKTKLQVKLGQYRLISEIIMCESLDAACFLGADFCDELVITIRPQD